MSSQACFTGKAAENVRLRSLISDLNYLNIHSQSVDDAGDSIFQNTNCKYYDCQEFNDFICANKSHMFSALHLNISSLSRHVDELNAMLGLLQFSFGIIEISESRFIRDVYTSYY